MNDADQDFVRRRPARKFLAGEAGGNDLPIFNSRDDKAEAIGRAAELVAPIGEADNRTAGVFDRGEVCG